METRNASCAFFDFHFLYTIRLRRGNLAMKVTRGVLSKKGKSSKMGKPLSPRFVNSAGKFDSCLWRKSGSPPLKGLELLSLLGTWGDMVCPLVSTRILTHKMTPLSMLDWVLFDDVPLVELQDIPVIPLDMVLHGAAPSPRTLPGSATAKDIVEFFRKWATPAAELKKLSKFLEFKHFSTLGECTIMPEMVDVSDMAPGTRMAFKCFLTRIYCFRRDKSVSSMERFYELLGSKFNVPEEDVQKFRATGYAVDSLYSASESRLQGLGISFVAARRIMVAALVYADRPDSARLAPYT